MPLMTAKPGSCHQRRTMKTVTNAATIGPAKLATTTPADASITNQRTVQPMSATPAVTAIVRRFARLLTAHRIAVATAATNCAVTPWTAGASELM